MAAPDHLIPDEAFTSAGAAVPLPYNGSTARVNFGPRTAARVRRWLRRGAFDLLHIHEPVTPSIALLALLAAEVPVVATFHTATPRSRSMQLAAGVLRTAVGKIDAGIAVSETARSVVVQHLGRDAVVIPNGFRFADFAGPAGAYPTAPSPSAPRIVFLGRLDEPRKGLDVLLAALPQVRAAVGEVEVVVAGQGSRVLPPGCISLGNISHPEKVALLRSASVFVAPHLARESFGIVLLEAMASGTPVVAAALPAFADLIGGGPGRAAVGELFAVGDAADLARALTDTLRRPDHVRTRRAREAARRYDWSVIAPQIVGVYRAALATSTQRAAARSDGTWAVLDAALVGRARWAAALATGSIGDSAAARRVADAAEAALIPDLAWHDREGAESDLSHASGLVGPPALVRPAGRRARSGGAQPAAAQRRRRGCPA